MKILSAILLAIILLFFIFVWILRKRVKNHNKIDLSQYDQPYEELPNKSEPPRGKDDQIKSKNQENEVEPKNLDIGFWTNKILSERWSIVLGQAKEGIDHWQNLISQQRGQEKTKEKSDRNNRSSR